MSHLADQVRGGVDPLQDFSAGFPLETRRARYAGRVVALTPEGNPIVERGSICDTLCAMLWDADTRPIKGWAHAWPVVGGSPVRPSGRSSSAEDASMFLAAFNAASGGVKPAHRGGSGDSLRIGVDAGGDFTVYGGQGWQRGFGLPSWAKLGIELQRPLFGIAIEPGAIIGGGAGDATHFFPGNGKGGSPSKVGVQGGAGGPMGVAGDAGAGQPGGAYHALGQRVTTPGDTPPQDFLIHEPILDGTGVADGAFMPMTSGLPPGWPSIVAGARGAMVAGTEHRGQFPVYIHGDPRMVAVNNGPDYRAGSVVCDTAPDGTFGFSARLQSAWRVVDRLYPSKGRFAGDGTGNSLAWQLARGERDGVPGYGSVVDLSPPGLGAGEAVTTLGESAPSNPPANGYGPGWVTINGVRFLMLASGAALTSWGPGYLGQVVSAAAMATAIGAAKASMASQPASHDVAPALTVGLSSARVGGPLEVGHKSKDRHRVGTSGDKHANATHLSTHSLFYADGERDGPLEFEKAAYIRPAAQPLTVRAHVRWDALCDGAGTAMGHGHIEGPGYWRVEAEAPFVLSVPYPPPVPPSKPPVTTPPATPPAPPTPTAPPPVFTRPDPPPITGGGPGPNRPPLPPLPGYPGHDPVTGQPVGLVFGDGGGGNGAGGSFGAMLREFSNPRAPDPQSGSRPIGSPAVHPTPLVPTSMTTMTQRTERGMRTDSVTAFPVAVGTTVALYRPAYLRAGEPDWRSSGDIDGADVTRRLAEIPYTLRQEAWGAHNGSRWLTTSARGGSRFVSGTMPGGALYLPPELDMKDVEAGRYVGAVSTSYVAAYQGVWFGAGTPVLTSGALKSGARWGFDGTSFVVQGLSSAAAAVTAFRVKTDGTAGVRETGGTILDVGAIADGAYVKRSGSSLVGATGSSIYVGTSLVTATGNFTTGSTTTKIRGRIVAGGGGGGGAATAAASAGAGGAGSSGSYTEFEFTVTPSTNYAVVIGAGGTVAVGGNGGAGAASTIVVGATTVTTVGGGGGIADPAGAIPASFAGGGTTAAGLNGDVIDGGAPGLPGIRINGDTIVSGTGGSNPLGAGGNGLVAAGAGINGVGYGSGGGGGGVTGGSVAVAGGLGAPGACVIAEYA